MARPEPPRSVFVRPLRGVPGWLERAVGLAVGVCALISSACALPSANIAAPASASTPAVFVEEQGEVDRARGRASGGIASGECPAEVGAPLAYFEGRVRLRLPQGIGRNELVEFSPFFARLSSPVESSTCRAGEPGAMLPFMALFMFEGQSNKPLEDLRPELLEALGYPDSSVVVEEESDGVYGGRWVYEVPKTEAASAAKMLLALTRDQDTVVAVVYEVAPEDWLTIVDSLLLSSTTISVHAGP